MINVWNTPIVAEVEQILSDLKLEVYEAGLLRDIHNTGSDIMCTCPFHKGGHERKPSCGVLLKERVSDGRKYEAGTVHCYTCGYTADLPQFTADLLGLGDKVAGYRWLVSKYTYTVKERPPLELDFYRGDMTKTTTTDTADVEQYHSNMRNSVEVIRYLERRKIKDWVAERYQIGYDTTDKTVLFPVKDLDGNVAFFKGRSIQGKHFYNAKDVDKTSQVYGLYEVMEAYKRGEINLHTKIWITESEIDALTLIGQGEYAVAIMGSHIADKQCRALERTPFRNFILALDNDPAGRKGSQQIKSILIPRGFRFTNLQWNTSLKDINDIVIDNEEDWRQSLTSY